MLPPAAATASTPSGSMAARSACPLAIPAAASALDLTFTTFTSTPCLAKIPWSRPAVTAKNELPVIEETKVIASAAAPAEPSEAGAAAVQPDRTTASAAVAAASDPLRRR